MFTLVTAGSSGIGRALAEECAKRKMNLLIVALPGRELEDTACEMIKKYGVKCFTLPIDLTHPKACYQVYNWVKENNFKINVLINNVGVGSKGNFDSLDPSFYHQQIQLNVNTATILTRLFIDDLQANGPSHILNMGSMGGFYTLPGKVVYTASKAYIYYFSRSLRLELKDCGVNVSVLCPGGTDSNENTIAINSELKGFAKWSIMMPDEVAAEAIEGMLNKKPRIIPGALNKFYYHLSRLTPEFIQNIFISNAFKHVKKHEY